MERFKGGHTNFASAVAAADDVCSEWSSAVTYAEVNEEIYRRNRYKKKKSFDKISSEIHH
jgi:hypothetical protein